MPNTHTAAWVAEFVLRQPVEDWLANEIFLALPLPSPLPFRLRRTILLRRLTSDLSRGSPSLHTLHSLDLLLDDPPTSSSSSSSAESMAVAYRAVALHCISLSFSASNYDAFTTFVDLLRSRVADLELAGPAVLAAEPLKKLRMEIDAAVESGIVSGGLLERDTSNEALDAIRVYLKAAMEELGPPFLELAAEIVARNGIELGEPCSETSAKSGDKVKVSGVAGGVGERTSSVSVAVNGEVVHLEKNKQISSAVVDHGGNRETVLLETNPETSSTSCDTLDKDMENEIARKQNAVVHLGKPTDKFDPMSAPEVEKVANALKSSCVDLHKVVVDPLPDAVMKATEVLKNRSFGMTNDVEELEIQRQVGASGPVSAAKNGSKDNGADEIVEQSKVGASGQVSAVKTGSKDNGVDEIVEQSKKNDALDVDGSMQQRKDDAVQSNREPSVEKQSDGIDNRVQAAPTIHAEMKGTGISNTDGVQKRSLMDRNPTAHTFEWGEDPIESSSDKSPAAEKITLPSPKRKKTCSPLTIMENKKLVIRRKRKRWSSLEEETLRKAVRKHGVGNWKFILSCFSKIFEDRTEVDLKDKWRNMTRH
ncbi:unnamed protein product [Musa acuminata subsp. malaccensis]|uniref:(wild Malaysian banana) hypothetical protein n=1 Tax=Musa acuminata subsp. malaccensis TaxID=214687 RepID=A0A804KQM1_MUSAM|nr:PREDICTED: uncharacterized protein LOC103999526 [Musa acuminata subsp. malaccensis]CAG1836990.1 unnamed protein product [Musa acuminata subsp. malaccensis]